VSGSAQVSDNARVFGDAQALGSAQVFTSLKIASGKVFGIKHKGETIQEITIPDSEDKLIGKKIS